MVVSFRVGFIVELRFRTRVKATMKLWIRVRDGVQGRYKCAGKHRVAG